MASVAVYPDRVIVRLSAAEKVLAMRRRDVVLERDAITSALITDDPWVWLRGVRSPGAHLPGRLALGTWRTNGGRDFVLLRSGRPAVVIDFDVHGQEPQESEPKESEPQDSEEPGWVGEFDRYARVVLSTNHAADLIRALRVDVDGGGAASAVFPVGS